VDEARQVLRRLDRIERLEREHASAAAVLAEVRALLLEAEAWVRTEGNSHAAAEAAVWQLRLALEERQSPQVGAERSLMA
jgi:hypothetical protein